MFIQRCLCKVFGKCAPDRGKTGADEGLADAEAATNSQSAKQERQKATPKPLHGGSRKPA